MNRNASRVFALLALVAWPLTVCLMFAAAPASAQSGMSASAEIKNKAGNVVGKATFTETGSGVRVMVQLSGITGLEGTAEHGIHVHQTASCEEPTFETAGEHFNPMALGHGMNNPNGEHAGDLPNITINGDGSAAYDATTTMFTLSPGELSVFDTDGSALVIHENPDDYMTDPSGKSGGRIMCGVIVQQAGLVGMPRTGAGTGDNLMLPLAFGAALLVSGVWLAARSRKADERI